MPRIARIVIPHYPHHVTQRGNRRQKVFFSDEDYIFYKEKIAAALIQMQVELWAYCLMPNHVHLVVVPETVEGLCDLFSQAHRHYTRRINFREGWRGHLWQERFHSFVMDENYLLATVRYVELNPVRARLCESAEDWPWSSVHAHLKGEDDELVTVKPMMDLVNDWHEYLGQQDQSMYKDIQRHSNTGRPLGNKAFIEKVQAISGRDLRRRKPGPKPKAS